MPNCRLHVQDDLNLRCLHGCKSWEAERRKITVTVVKGKDLAAKDRPGLLTEASSDPYYSIEFKDKPFVSEYIPKTLDSEWKLSPFELGTITEAETAPLKIMIFDYDSFSSDDFMGVIRVPGCALYDLGPGHHTFWFLAGHTKEEPYAKEDVSGYVLIHFVVQEVKSAALRQHTNDS